MIIYLAIFVLLITGSEGTICVNITIGSKTYDLGHLKNMTQTEGYVVSPCDPMDCLQNTNYLYNTFIIAGTATANNCTALTAGSQPSQNKLTQTDTGLVLSYSTIKKYHIQTLQNNTNIETTTKLKTIVHINCNKQTNAVQNVTFTNDSIYTFNIKSPAGCSFETDTQIWTYYRDKAIIFALVFWIIGLYSMFLGLFLIRVTVFVYGFVTAAGFSLIFFTFGYPLQDQTNSVLNWMIILSAILGLFYGFFVITLPRFGYFNIGIWFGIIISLLLQNSVLVYTKTLIPFYVCLGVISFICGVAGIMGFKYFIIVSTSLISGFLLVRPLGFYLPYYPNQFNFYKQSEAMPWQYYLYLIAIVILSIISIIFQAWLFKKRGRKDKLFNLQDNTDFKTKFKNLLQFKQIKNFLSKGTNQFKMLKNLVTSKHSNNNDDERQSDVQQYPKATKKGKYTPPSVSDDVSNQDESERDSDASIEMKQIKKPSLKNIRKNR